MTINFRKWLLRQVKRNDPVGDLARDFKADFEDAPRDPSEPDLPKRATVKTLRAYLVERNVSKSCLITFDRAVVEYMGMA